MSIQGRAFFYEKTKKIRRIHHPEDIVFITHQDIDEVAAQSLIDHGVKVMINEKSSMSGRFYHEGVKRLLEANVRVFDLCNTLSARVVHGKQVMIERHQLFLREERLLPIAIVEEYDRLRLAQLEKKAREVWLENFIKFGENSIRHADKELSLLRYCWERWPEGRAFLNEEVLIVSRGNHYKEDLSFAFQLLPLKNITIVAVDGAADTCASLGYIPDYIVGDMDSVSNDLLQSGAKLIVHENERGEAPGMKRLERLGLTAMKKRWAGVSEDVAIIHSLKEGAKRLFIVGGQRGMEEYLAKGREGMGSSLLVRMIAGSRIIDLKGIHACFQELLPISVTGRYPSLLTLLERSTASPVKEAQP